MSLVLSPLWIITVKISISGLMYVTGVIFLMDYNSEDRCMRSYMYVTGVISLMDNNSEDQYIRSNVCHWCYLPYGL